MRATREGSCPSCTGTGTPHDPTGCTQLAHAAALAGLPGVGPATLAQLLGDARPADAWRRLLGGQRPLQGRVRIDAPIGHDIAALAARYRAAGVGVHTLAHPGYPTALLEDPGAPAVLFSIGSPESLAGGARVAVVGTRAATRYGIRVAAQLGAALAAAGVVVVSGLAQGIDGAAHEGALAAHGPSAAPPVAVAGTGLDVPYPRSHARLWDRVASAGLVLSEAPLGAPAMPWRFPERNRIIAGLADVVVVVECHGGGGSLHTVEAAIARSRPVMAVPGSVRSPASVGTNALLADGCAPARDADDVLTALALVHPAGGRPDHTAGGGRCGVPPTGSVVADRAGGLSARYSRASGPDLRVLDAVDPTPTSFETIVSRSGMSIGAVAAALGRLGATDEVVGGDGWWERLE